MGKEVREISRFFVVPTRAFPLSVWRGFTDFLTQKCLHLSSNTTRIVYPRPPIWLVFIGQSRG